MNILGFVTLAIVFFLINWVVCGAIFATIGFTFVRRMRMALFSGLFTAFAMVVSGLTAGAGMILSKPLSASCDVGSSVGVDALAETIACGMTAYTGAAISGIVLMFIIGFLLMRACVQKTDLPKSVRAVKKRLAETL